MVVEGCVPGEGPACCLWPPYRIYFRKRIASMPKSMPSGQRQYLSAYRRRLKRRGVVRVEVRVHKADAPLVRSVAQALSDPAQEDEARFLLRERFGPARAAADFKAHLAAAPLEGIDLSRDQDVGRSIEL